MTVPDKIYEEWIRETDAIGIKADTPAVQVVGELTRALKRVVMNNGGTAITINGVRYNANNEPLPG